MPETPMHVSLDEWIQRVCLPQLDPPAQLPRGGASFPEAEGLFVVVAIVVCFTVGK